MFEEADSIRLFAHVDEVKVSFLYLNEVNAERAQLSVLVIDETLRTQSLLVQSFSSLPRDVGVNCHWNKLCWKISYFSVPIDHHECTSLLVIRQKLS